MKKLLFLSLMVIGAANAVGLAETSAEKAAHGTQIAQRGNILTENGINWTEAKERAKKIVANWTGQTDIEKERAANPNAKAATDSEECSNNDPFCRG